MKAFTYTYIYTLDIWFTSTEAISTRSNQDHFIKKIDNHILYQTFIAKLVSLTHFLSSLATLSIDSWIITQFYPSCAHCDYVLVS